MATFSELPPKQPDQASHKPDLTEVRTSAYTGDTPSDRSATTRPAAVDWTKPLTAGINEMYQIKGNQAADAPHVAKADAYLQTALLTAQAQGAGATKDLVNQVYGSFHVDERLNGPNGMRNDADFRKVLAAYHIDPDKKTLTPDEIRNAVVNMHLDSPPGTQLTEAQKAQRAQVADYLDLMSLQNAHEAQTNSAMAAVTAPALTGMIYADFLLNQKNGVSRWGGNGDLFTAGDIIRQVNAGPGDIIPTEIANNMLARMQSLQQQARGTDQPTDPLGMLDAVKDVRDLAGYQAAYQAAHQPGFLDGVRKQIADINASTTLTQAQKNEQLAAWTAELHAPALTAIMLGRSEMAQDKPDNAAALKHIQEGAADEVATRQVVGTDGKPLVPDLLASAQAGLNMQTRHSDWWSVATDPATAQATSIIDTNLQRMAQLTQNPNGDNLAQANSLGEAAMTQARIVAHSMAPYKDAIDAEYKRVFDKYKNKENLSADETAEFQRIDAVHRMAHMDTLVQLQRANVDVMQLNPDSAQAKLQEMRENDRDFVNNDVFFNQGYEKIMANAKELSQSRDTGWAALGDKWEAMKDWASNHKTELVIAAAAIAAGAVTFGVGAAAVAALGTGALTVAGVTAATAEIATTLGVSTTMAGLILGGGSTLAGFGVGGTVGASTGSVLDRHAGRVGSFGEGFANNASLAFKTSGYTAAIVGTAGFGTLGAGAATADAAVDAFALQAARAEAMDGAMALTGEGTVEAGALAAPSAQAAAAPAQLLTRMAPGLGRIPLVGSSLESGANTWASNAAWNSFRAARMDLAGAIAPRVTTALEGNAWLGAYAPTIGRVTAGAAQSGFVIGLGESPELFQGHFKQYTGDVATAMMFGGAYQYLQAVERLGWTLKGALQFGKRWTPVAGALYAKNVVINRGDLASAAADTYFEAPMAAIPIPYVAAIGSNFIRDER
jgi:hypothetical protein